MCMRKEPEKSTDISTVSNIWLGQSSCYSEAILLARVMAGKSLKFQGLHLRTGKPGTTWLIEQKAWSHPLDCSTQKSVPARRTLTLKRM